MGRNWEMLKCEVKDAQGQGVPKFCRWCLNLKLDGNLPGLILASQVSLGAANECQLEFGRKVPWVNDRFARCEMTMENVSAHDFKSDVGT